MNIAGHRAALLAVLVLGVSAFAGVPAQARQARLFAGTFGAAASSTANPYPLGGGAHAVAVNSVAGPSQGDVYVTDTANRRVEKFDSSGHFLLMFGKEVNQTAVEAGATRAGEEDVCPAAGHPADICQPGTAASTPGALESPSLIAVDNSSGPSQGDVYVDTGSGRQPFDETQIVGLSESVTGGTFTLSFEGQTTAPIAYNASAQELGGALEALPAIGSKNVFVELVRPAYFPNEWGVEFVNKLAAKNVSQITVNFSGLAPFGTTAKVSTEQQGNPLVPDLVTKFDPQGQLLSGWASGGQLDGSLAPGGPFAGVLGGIAVDPAGNLWVLGRHENEATFQPAPHGPSSAQAFEFGQEAGPRGGWSAVNRPGVFEAPVPGVGLLVDAEDNLYFKNEPGSLLRFSPTGTRLGVVVAPAPGNEQLTSYALDQSLDELFVGSRDSSSPTEVQRYPLASCHPSGDDNPCTSAESFGSNRLAGEYTGLAVDPSSLADPLYVLGEESRGASELTTFAIANAPEAITAKASGFTATTATLNGTVEPEGVTTTHCFFEWGTSTAYGNRAACAQGEVLAGSGKDQVSAEIAGLTPGTTYHFRFVASNANTDLAEEPSRGADLAFGAPLVLGTSALGVSATSAILQTELNANNLETHYRFEYDTVPYAEGEGPHGISFPVPDASLGSGAAVVTVGDQIEGLAPSTAYYYRVVATNTLGITDGPDGSFVSQPAASGPPLLDGRVWEMVSPPQKSGASIRGIDEVGGGVVQASAGGDGLAFVANGSFGQEAPGDRSFQPSQFLAFRGANGWSTKDVTTPRKDVVGVIAGNTEGYEAFSRDLSFGAVNPRGLTPLSPLATETTPYLRAANGEFLPLVDSLDVPPETVFDGKVNEKNEIENEPEIEGGSPDLHSVVIRSCFKLTKEAVNLCRTRAAEGGNQSLYVWHEGTLRLASVLPNNHPAEGQAELGENFLKRHAVSEDGTRLVFSVGNGLYLRDMALAKTVRLDLPEPGAAGGAEGAQFEDMSADGSKVFFTDSIPLTKNSNEDGDHQDLYMCEIVIQGEALTCALKDLSVARNAGEAGAVLGDSIGADSSGRYVYFVANGALTPGAAPGDCEVGGVGVGTCGLYLYDTVAGTIKLVTPLSGADAHDWAKPRELSELTARVSPNGRFLAFMSQRSLTGYDNRDAVSGQPDQEVYLYDRLGNGGEGKLVCASCNPTGARPHGVEIVTNADSLLNEEGIWSGGTWLAAAIPGWTPYSLVNSVYQSRYLSDSGRLFFNSADALVPRDSNGTTDVYEYEPPQGEGQPASNNCSAASPNYSPGSDGCIDMVSSGTSPEESAFLDASESGDDVFFLTAAQLVPADVDSANDIYDARVDGAVSEVVKPPACEGDACQNPVGAPEDPTPGSLTFQGPGNPLPSVSASAQGTAKPATRAQKLARALKACARKPKRQRATCNRQARRSYGPVGKAKKSNRRTHR